jgi:hypothetical protein
VWRVLQTDGVLTLASVVKGVAWSPGEALVAECLGPRLIPLPRLRPHAAPGPRCECGIYATDLARASRYLRDSNPFDLGRVLGRVALWGTVVECERGFRASHAYPVALYVPLGRGNGSAQRALELAEGLSRYGVPVELRPREQPDLAPAA